MQTPLALLMISTDSKATLVPRVESGGFIVVGHVLGAIGGKRGECRGPSVVELSFTQYYADLTLLVVIRCTNLHATPCIHLCTGYI